MIGNIITAGLGSFGDVGRVVTRGLYSSTVVIANPIAEFDLIGSVSVYDLSGYVSRTFDIEGGVSEFDLTGGV